MLRSFASTHLGLMIVTSSTVEAVRQQVRDCLHLLQHYDWLVNSFVLDHFLDGHWTMLPSSWQTALASSSPLSLAAWLDSGCETSSQPSTEPWPLSLLALKQSLQQLSLPRRPVQDLSCVAQFHNLPADSSDKAWQFEPEMLSASGGQHQSLRHVFRKHVKPKKQYEMCRLAKLISSVAQTREVEKVLDIGSGVGHLSRYLCYNNNLTVACVDGNDNLTTSARKFDEELEKTVSKMRSRCDGDQLPPLPPSPVHVTAHIAPDMDLDSFHDLLRNNFGMEEEKLVYGLVGLHTCGDLAPVILRMFVQDGSAGLLTSLGCCYMKIKENFPMSEHVRSQPWSGLTYTSTELSCHGGYNSDRIITLNDFLPALEMYCEKLRQGEEDKLKVHCYRAVLESLLAERNPQYRHTILKTVSKSHLLSFPEYVTRATAGLVTDGLRPFTEEELSSDEVLGRLKHWWRVVTFYTLRLAFAPVIGGTHSLNIQWI